MSKIRKIRIEELTPQSFQPYGRVIDLSSNPEKTIGGEGWQCWFPIQTVEGIRRLNIGITFSKKQDVVVTSMERHPNNEEILFAVQHALVQPMGLPDDREGEDARPDPDTVRAFLLRPGQGIIMKKGAWHSPAVALEQDTHYYFFADSEGSYPWMEFQGDVSIIAEL